MHYMIADLHGLHVTRLQHMQSRQWVDGSWVSGPMGQMGYFFGWVTWVMGRCRETCSLYLAIYKETEGQSI